MLALIPLLFFIAMYLIGSIVAGDFYKIPISVAFLATAVVAVSTSKGRLTNRIKTFSKGAGDKNMMLMIWIFILAGAFANTAKVIGCVDDMVYLTLSIVPANAVLVGLFLAAAAISLSIGTSVGTIVALTPIAAGLASATATSVPMMTAIVVGGAFFGDNLSFISDTTVVATQSQGCKMADKFKTNIRIALPAAITMVVAYGIIGSGTEVKDIYPEVSILKVIPYILVLVTAITGMNVLLVLGLGIILTGVIGIHLEVFDIFGWFSAINEGALGMGELIIVTMLAGGILELTRKNGGIRFLMNRLLKHVHSQRSAELSIAALVSLVDVCTANNTVAIITVAGIAKDISHRFALDPKRVASILDTFSCMMQGIIPYGAQLLMASALANLNPLDIIPYLYYPYALGTCALLTILIRRHHPSKHHSSS